MSNLVDLLILSLATWRISVMLVKEAGPADIFAKLRYRVGIRYDEFSVPQPTNLVSSIFNCLWCMSVWVAYELYVIYAVFNNHRGVYELLITPLAISALAIWLHGRITRQ